jgi:hypothetical protein
MGVEVCAPDSENSKFSDAQIEEREWVQKYKDYG